MSRRIADGFLRMAFYISHRFHGFSQKNFPQIFADFCLCHFYYFQWNRRNLTKWFGVANPSDFLQICVALRANFGYTVAARHDYNQKTFYLGFSENFYQK
ncbi:MAG: hypothetical protein LBE36_09405 [Flavobacteriaceae bacterium]|nr:hypothetical protein [Flavobacteriaceae bacterium]